MHHLNKINTNVDFWSDKVEWQQLLEIPEILPTQLSLNKLQRNLLIDTLDWDSLLKSEWKQLNQ